ncbi:TonB-dependent receptor [Phenylobacterium sp.]|uniref:TonB-dependent receptor n=1 Tax=Phenylobacterium sp. TaxID=1871053 RepID=UPI0027347560|nr:TonB-dependent receptor [Phenylobacterium sp.]MDP3854411.1 TonB-dependent receptor [Phenylobacterium sp.]
MSRTTTHARRAWPRLLLATTMLTAMGASGAVAQELEEVVVTAQKREENLQSIPVSIQAIGEQKLDELQVADFTDFVKFLPSVAFRTGGPGFTNIYMRGVASGENSNHSGPLPSVGVYLDEQPVTTITGPLDIHVYDMARIEALAGPQGTLYGASSQAGTIRYITNKPEIGHWEGGYDVEVNQVDDGGPGFGVEGFVNIPVSDKMAVRLVGWHQHDGGYVDNVAGTRTFPTSGVTINNAAQAEEDYNDADTTGARAALRIDLDDNWTISPTIMAQETKANGLFAYDPAVGDLKVTHFYPESIKDRWYQAALAIQGTVANLDLVYAGAYMKRNIDTQSDYSDYSFFYDTLFGYGAYITDDAGAFINPSQYIQGKDRFTKESHEFRLSTPAGARVRLVGGLFYQRQTHNIEQRYKIDNLAAATEVPGWSDTLWLTKQLREDVDSAVFGELTYDVTDKLTGTVGVRGFKSENSLKGFFGFGLGYSSGTGVGGCFGPPVVSGGPCTNLNKTTEETGYTYKVNLTYKIDEDRMVYGIVSTGFRPGGINRRGTLAPYESDFLTNYEAGWKTTWLNNRLRWNGAVFYETWEDFQFSFLGANGLTEIKNAGQAKMTGVESDINWLVGDGLTIFGSAAYIDAKLDENYCGTVDASGKAITNCAVPQAPDGTQLPITPKLKANLSARYEWDVGDMRAHVQGSAVYQSRAWTDLRVAERAIVGALPSYATFDFTAGVEGDGWTIEGYMKNVTDERGNVSRFAQCATSVCGAQTYIVPNRPRTFGIRFGQKF